MSEALLSIEDEAYRYSLTFQETLRCSTGWNNDAFMLIQLEMGSFVGEVLEYEFTPLSMWEYWYLAQVVSKYLGDMQSAYLAHLAYERVRRGIAFISGELQEHTFSTEERNSICRAQINLENEIQKWTKIRARE